MLTIYFCFGDALPIVRCWPGVPRIGDTIAFTELGGNLNRLIVSDVVWEGDDIPSISVYLQETAAVKTGDEESLSGERV